MQRVLGGTSILLGATLVVGAACATGGGGAVQERERCALRSTDSIFVSSGPVFRDCAVDRAARVVGKQIEPEFTQSRSPGCHSVQLEFVVGTDGAPEIGTARTVGTNNPVFARAVIETLPRWKYEPARIEGVPVRQIVAAERKMALVVVVVRSGSVPPPRSSVRPHC